MGKFNEIDYTIKEIKQWFKDKGITIILIIILGVLLHIITYQENVEKQEQENRITTIESRLNKQMNYIHGLEADIHEIKEQEVLNR